MLIPKSEGNSAVAVPTQAVLERIVDKMQRKDNFNIFKEPVTEAMAPGYFQVVQRGMDFTTMRSKVQGDAYTTWQDFQEDMDVMFGNAMAYNTPDTVYHKQARSLKTVATKMIELAKQGVTDFRGKTVQESRAHNAQIAAEEQAYRNEQRSAKSASLASKVAEQFASAGSGMPLRHMSTAGSHAEAAESSGQPARAPPRVHRPVVRESDMRKFAGQEEQNNRATYWQTPSAQFYAHWKGLAAGASAESVALQPGRPILRPLILLGRDSYARSIARFTSGLKGKFKELAKTKAAPCVFPEPASHPQLSHPVQLPSSSIPRMTPSVPGVASAVPTAAGASVSNNARSALPISSAPTGMHGSLAAGPSAYAGHVQSTGAASKSVSHLPAASPLPAARPVPMAYSAAQPQPLVNASNSVQNHL